MKHLKKFFELNESQSKKIKKVLTFSVILDWYNDNKDKISKIVGCNPEELISEYDLIEQSKGLVNKVINTQHTGNEGSNTNEISGFSAFKPLDQYLLHDILHNIYDVSRKDFDKSLSNIQFTESEVFEEIEILCIEESFMKFCNIKYPKTDFINQNINQLASFLMMAILKNDPTRIKDILDDKIKPYLEVYGVKYEVNEGSPFEDFFLVLKSEFRDLPKIDNSEDFKDYMIKLINVGVGIGRSSGDRANYPDDNYYGDREFSDANDSEILELIDVFKRRREDNYIILSTDDVYDIEDLEFKGIKLNSRYKKNIDYDDLPKLELPFKKEFLGKDGYINLEKWFKFLSEKSGKDFYGTKDNEYLVIYKGNDNYRLIDYEEFSEKLSDSWDYNGDNTYDDDHEFINFEDYEKMSFEEVSKKLFSDTDSISIMRRNFRDNDIIVNNTKLGGIYKAYWSSAWEQKKINLKNDKSYIDFTSDREDKVSISKNVITNNGKKLISVLNSIRGYAIKNYKELKNKYNLGKKFTKEDIRNYTNLDIPILSLIKNRDIYFPSYKLSINLSKNQIIVRPEYITSNIIKYLLKIDDIISLLKKIQNKDDINFLKSYVQSNRELINNFNNNRNSLDFYHGILDTILENKESIGKLLNFNEEITKGLIITKDEAEELINIKNKMDSFSPNASIEAKLNDLIEKYYGIYDPIIELPSYYYGDNISDITIDVRKLPF